MSGIAEVLLNLGHHVSGSDLKETDITKRLSSLGAEISNGHKEENIAGADVVVTSSAIVGRNPEVEAARRAFVPVIPRAEMLAELMRLKSSVAVAGSHGKTTTTSLVGMLLAEGGLDPTMVIGGKLDSIGSNARLGDGDFLVAEADESDGSFLLLSPTIAVVTNIDLEHLDYYRDLDHIKETFLAFINKIPFYGLAVVCLDDPNAQSVVPDIRKRYISYGLSAQADVRAVNLEQTTWGSTFDVIFRGEQLGKIELSIPGRHNVLNSLAAIGVAMEFELPFEVIASGLSRVGGIHRRFQFKGEVNGITVLDDYGHHPTEIKTTLDALRTSFPDRRLVVLFQPHRYSRTSALFEDFSTAFNKADKLILTDIYPAGEKPIEGVTGEALAESVRLHGHHESSFYGDVKTLPLDVLSDLKPGDVVMTMGAGNIWQAGEEILELLRDGRAD